MILSWTNPIANVLWFLTLPVPGYIEFKGGVYTLYLPGVAGGYTYQTGTFDDAEQNYMAQATSSLVATPTVLEPTLMAFVPPADAQVVVFVKTDKTYGAGTYSATDHTITVTGSIISSTDVLAWAPLPP